MLYGDFTIEESEDIGKKFKVTCKANYGYKESLTKGKEYEIEISGKILPCSPLCKFTGDNGKTYESHLTRFEKIKEK